MEIQTLTPAPTPARAHSAAARPEAAHSSAAHSSASGRDLATTPDCDSERLWTALRARWLGRCREANTMEREIS
jgi:hypothetical protein